MMYFNTYELFHIWSSETPVYMAICMGTGSQDLRVQQLANGINKAQRKEIKEMKWLIKDIEANGLASSEEEANQRPIPEFKSCF